MRDYRNELLSKSTSAEKAVCQTLNAMNIKFIRQYQVKTPRKMFYLDIYIPSLMLAIEVDGKYHYTDTQKRLDANRSACIRRMGIHVFRIDNPMAHKPSAVKKLLERYLKRKK